MYACDIPRKHYSSIDSNCFNDEKQPREVGKINHLCNLFRRRFYYYYRPIIKMNSFFFFCKTLNGSLLLQLGQLEVFRFGLHSKDTGSSPSGNHVF